MNIEPINVEHILLNSSVVLIVLSAVATIFAIVLVSKTLFAMAVALGISCWLALLVAFVLSIKGV
ncbi:MAG: hypothetical protein IJV56_00020 [Neisseriaceae bacterium]|nr:hypothetical protein [Neisseriaceae bacterium]MBQ9723717.1 hypothetical protein [Neisseriaceae bacterium]